MIKKIREETGTSDNRHQVSRSMSRFNKIFSVMFVSVIFLFLTQVLYRAICTQITPKGLK